MKIKLDPLVIVIINMIIYLFKLKNFLIVGLVDYYFSINKAGCKGKL